MSPTSASSKRSSVAGWVVAAAVVVEQPQRQPVTPDEPGAEQADRPAAGDQDSAIVVGHARSLTNQAGYREPADWQRRKGFLDRTSG